MKMQFLGLWLSIYGFALMLSSEIKADGARKRVFGAVLALLGLVLILFAGAPT